MNTALTEIAFVLDRSGSMASMAEEAVSGFNAFLREQQQAEGLARLTLVLFDDRYEVPLAALPVEEALPIDSRTYVPRGSTALLDAIGQTIDDLGARLAAVPEADRPGAVVVAILTDGHENASSRYAWQAVSDRIRHQADVYKWEFLFLGANQDAIATAAQLSIPASGAAMWAADPTGLHASTAAYSRKLNALRRRTSGRATREEIEICEAPLTDLVEEEDRKRRS